MSKPHRYSDQPRHLEDVLNDINEELYTTHHGLSFGAASLLRFLATIAWTSKDKHPEWYATINPKYAKIAAMARMTGASVSSIKRYLKELDDGWIKRQHQYGRDGFRDEDRMWMLWSDVDRKNRAELIAVTSPDFFDDDDLDVDGVADLTSKAPRSKHDNRYWVQPRTGQFWRHDNKDHKVADDEVMVTLSSAEARFFWSNNDGIDTTRRRLMMQHLTGPGGHARLAKWITDHEARMARRRHVA